MAPKRSNAGSLASTAVTEYLAKLDHPHKAGIEELRCIILGLDKRITEEIKWNAPSFKIEDHFATFKLYPQKNIQLVLHTGAKAKSNTKSFVVEDPDNLLKWPATDRCVLSLASSAALESHRPSVLRILEQWLAKL